MIFSKGITLIWLDLISWLNLLVIYHLITFFFYIFLNTKHKFYSIQNVKYLQVYYLDRLVQELGIKYNVAVWSTTTQLKEVRTAKGTVHHRIPKSFTGRSIQKTSTTQ